MKPTLRDYLTIFFALLVIFLCGSGVGFLVGEKKGRQESPSAVAIPPGNRDDSWEKRTMERLNGLLILTAEQRTKVEAEVKASSERILQSREDAVRNHYGTLLELHDRLLPHLNAAQQEKIKKDRKSLQQAIDLRFQSSAPD